MKQALGVPKIHVRIDLVRCGRERHTAATARFNRQAIRAALR